MAKHVLLTGATGMVGGEALNACLENDEIGKVGKADYRKITVDYTDAFARMLKNHSPEAVFCLFNAMGAVSSEKSLVSP